MRTLLQDLRYALRMMAKNLGFTAVAVLTLALGIGANTAIFSVVNAVLFQRPPVPSADRVVIIWVNNPAHGWSRVGPTGQDYLDWRVQSKSFEDLFLFEHGTGTITGQGEPEQVRGLRVTTNFGGFFGIKPLQGRTFRLEEAQGRHNLMILSYGYWQRRLASDPSVAGKAIKLNGESYTIIGVLPAGVQTLFPADIVVPFDTDWLRRADSRLGVFGRLKPGVTLGQASNEMSVLAERIGRERPSREGWGVVLVPLMDVLVEYIRPALVVLLSAVGFVLLIACANVANLMLARAVSRQKEIAVRLALGAGRFRLIRQLLAESTLLGLLGGAAGLLLADWGVSVLMRVVPSQIPVLNAAAVAPVPQVHVDGTVLAFAVTVSLLTGIIFGLVPAFQSTRCDVTDSLKEGGRGSSSGPQGHRARGALVIAEVALAFVLVIGAGLMIKSFWRLLESNPGFNPDDLLTLQLKLPNDAKGSKYREPWQQAAAFQKFLGSVERLPGIRAAGLTEIVPLSQEDMDMGFFLIQEAPPPSPGERLAADVRNISPSYFGTMGIPLEKGRVFTDQDNQYGPPVVIIDETLARRYFPDQDSVGKRLQMWDATHVPREIVGVVGGVRDTGYDQQPRPTIYFPYLQSPSQTMGLVLRTGSPPASIMPAIKDAIWSVDKDQPVYNVRTMDEIISGTVSAQRLAFFLLSIFAFLSLTLAAVGIYGVSSYSISQRTHEIGIRMAIGAQRRDILKLVVGQGIAFALTGLGIGIAGALLMTRFLSSLLYSVKPTDPLTFIAVSLGLALVALAACYIPARRATKVDPMVALRFE